MLLGSLILGLALAQAPDTKGADPGDAVINEATLTSIERLDVPGADPGVLVKLNVHLGDKVKAGQELARIDDREAQANVEVKRLEYEAAQKEADSKVEIQYQDATAKVAQKAYEKLDSVNKKTPGAVTQIDILKAELEWDKAKLGIKKAEEKNVTDGMTADAKKAEWNASKVSVERRILRAPFDGVVINIYKKPGEWVTAGEPVMELVRIDRLGVRGSLPADQWTPAEIDGRNVTVEVKLPRGRTQKVRGRVVFASEVVESSGSFPVWAEIDTPFENDHPLIRAGMQADLAIHVKEPVMPVARANPPAVEPATRKTGTSQPPAAPTKGTPRTSAANKR